MVLHSSPADAAAVATRDERLRKHARELGFATP